MAKIPVKFAYDTKANYTSATKNAGTLYFLHDTKELYRGSQLIANAMTIFDSSASATNPKEGDIGYDSGAPKIYKGGAWVDLVKSLSELSVSNLTVTTKLSATAADVVTLSSTTATALTANLSNANVNTAAISTLSATTATAVTANLSTATANNLSVKTKLSATAADVVTLSATTVKTPDLSTTRLSAANLSATNISAASLSATSISAANISATTKLSAKAADVVTLSATTATAVTANLSTATANNLSVKTKLSATAAEVVNLTASNLSVTTKLSAKAADVVTLSADEMSANSERVTDLTATNISATTKLSAKTLLIPDETSMSVGAETLKDYVEGKIGTIGNVMHYVGNVSTTPTSQVIELVDKSKLTASVGDIVLNLKNGKEYIYVGNGTDQFSDSGSGHDGEIDVSHGWEIIGDQGTYATKATVNSLSNELTSVRANVSTLSNTTIPAITGKVNNISSAVSTITATTIPNLSNTYAKLTDFNTLTGNVNTISGVVNTITATTIPAITGDVSTISSDVSTLKTWRTGLTATHKEDDDNGISVKVTTTDGAVSSVDVDVTLDESLSTTFASHNSIASSKAVKDYVDNAISDNEVNWRNAAGTELTA